MQTEYQMVKAKQQTGATPSSDNIAELGGTTGSGGGSSLGVVENISALDTMTKEQQLEAKMQGYLLMHAQPLALTLRHTRLFLIILPYFATCEK
jgi:hypothetical protein